MLDGQSVVEEYVKHRASSTASWGSTETVSYLQGPSGPMYRLSSSSADPSWYVYDGLGSVVGEVSVTGTLTATEDRDVYGNLRHSSGTKTTSHGFVGSLGHQTDDETGLVYMRARYYDPAIGRFISEDPGAQGTNWYTYCFDNPVNQADKNGKESASTAEVLAFLAACTDISAMAAAMVESPKLAGALAIIAIVMMVAANTATGRWEQQGMKGMDFVHLFIDVTHACLATCEMMAWEIKGAESAGGGIAVVAVIATCLEANEIMGECETQNHER